MENTIKKLLITLRKTRILLASVLRNWMVIMAIWATIDIMIWIS